MNYFEMITLTFVLIAISAVQTTKLSTCDLKKTHIDCEITEYKSYVECVRSRMKRSTGCYDSDEEESCEDGGCNTSCNDCDCQSCTASQCRANCNKKCCSSCCAFESCSSNHCCHKTCHTNCHTSSCRSSCRKSCYKAVKSATASNSSNTVSNKEVANITTVIHLNNVINNTNLIDIPINLNSSNVNNLTMDDAARAHETETLSSYRQQCCNLVEPRQCTSTDTFPYVRCFHLRKQHCGDVCRAPIVHQIPQRYCFNNQNQAQQCQQRNIYVPQPQATNCQYQSGWPFNSCSGGQAKSCTGCYDQYFNPYAGHVSCHSSCYNYGYDRSTLNQQGAWYNRGYQIQMLPYTGQNTGAYPMLNAYGNTNGIPENILNIINGGSSTIPYFVIPPKVLPEPTSNAEMNSTSTTSNSSLSQM